MSAERERERLGVDHDNHPAPNNKYRTIFASQPRFSRSPLSLSLSIYIYIYIYIYRERERERERESEREREIKR